MVRVFVNGAELKKSDYTVDNNTVTLSRWQMFKIKVLWFFGRKKYDVTIFDGAWVE